MTVLDAERGESYKKVGRTVKFVFSYTEKAFIISQGKARYLDCLILPLTIFCFVSLGLIHPTHEKTCTFFHFLSF